MNAHASTARASLRTAAVMLGFTAAFTALMAAAYQLTRPAIQASEQDALRRLVDEVLPPASYDNALLEDAIRLGPTAALGLDDGGRAWRARKGGAPAALVLEAAATDGYAGRIGVVVAVGTDGSVHGVRVVSHKETPGLGDYIDPKRDRDKAAPWISQFAGARWNEADAARWTVVKDGGLFDYRTGATISARAVARITGRAAAFAMAQREALFAAPAGSMLQGNPQ